MNKKLTDREFKKLLKTYDKKKIIYKYINWEINLRSSQIDKLIETK